jgi:branched-chain amino acid transport system substrate-binding protein
MSRRYAVAATGVVLVAAALLSACGTNRSEGEAAGGSSCDTSKGTLVIGMIAPMSGGVSAFGLGMRNSADLAIDQANENCTVPGYRLVFQPEDDQSLPQIAAQAATKLASDPTVAAVVGTYNSSTAQSAAPILAQRSIVQVSPANTGPALTRGEKAATQPRRPFRPTSAWRPTTSCRARSVRVTSCRRRARRRSRSSTTGRPTASGWWRTS